MTYPFHCVVAFPVSMLVGAWPDELLYERHYYGTVLGVSPCSAIIAAILGYAVNLKARDRSAPFAFVPALLLLGEAVSETVRGWQSSGPGSSLTQFVVDNMMGIQPRCEGDCFGAIFTIALGVSLAYSAGALVALVRSSPTPKTPIPSPAESTRV